MKRLVKVLAATSLLLLFGCVGGSTTHGVIALATAHARHAGYVPEHYDPDVRYDQDGEAEVLFVGKDHRPGNLFIVVVNPETG